MLLGALCTGLAAALLGCSAEDPDPDAGTNGVGKLSPAKIERKARTAAVGAESVRLSGSVVSKGRTYKLDMRLRKGEGGTGQVSTEGTTFELLRAEKDLYLKADAAFWEQQESASSEEDAAAAEKLDGKYVKVPSEDPAYRQLSGFTDMEVLLGGLLALHGELSAGERGTVGGVRTVRVDGGKGKGGALDVSLEGTPYPLRLERAGDAGVLRLADWNEDFRLEEPDRGQIVDYGRQISTGG